MHILILARNPTASLSEGYLPAAHRLGATVTLLTDQPAAHHRGEHGPHRVVGCDVLDVREVVATVAGQARPDAVFSNSDHLQTQTALAAEYLGLPGKDWRATLRAKNKALMRAHLADAGLDTVFSASLRPGEEPGEVPFPCVLKPREGVASEDVFLIGDAAELRARIAEVRTRRPGEVLLVEEFLAGPLHTCETLGDGLRVQVLGGFTTTLSAPPRFVEQSMTWRPTLPATVRADLLGQLDALGVGFGACHTEFVPQGGRARLVEVNYRSIGDRCDLVIADLLGVPLFEQVLLVHLGRPAPRFPPAPGHARLDYLLATGGGRLVHAEPALDRTVRGVRLVYRPLRAPGEVIIRTGTNRDYLGVLYASGHDVSTVDAVAAEFLRANGCTVAG